MKIYNFAAGPAVLPTEVMMQAQKEFMDYAGTGMSIMEMTHRGKVFQSVIDRAEATLRELMGIPENYKVLFLQGGASTQFSMIPLNLARHQKAYYVISGSFGDKAYKEAVKCSETLTDIEPVLLASSKEEHYAHLATFDAQAIDPNAAYVHVTLNNTIEGTTIFDLPETNGVPLVGDMSSDILAVRYNVEKFGLIYAGAQKNIGPAGVTVVIVREDLLPEKPVLSSMLDYRILADNGSLYNTPPTFGIYMAGLVFDWVNSLGGVDAMESRNREKAALLYDYLDSQDFYISPVEKKDERSICNVVFRTSNPEMDADFVAAAEKEGFMNIKGHRSVGGMRASIYNAFPRQGVVDLVTFMQKFEKEHH
ncbi:MAG: 3-phosphoserine/phosphohydroxythreonine transaminase [Streptococcaceae bacterium]|jgi:phosphoserine aminotransferase|nr:3-phosphoserine/phosphohydroxythreonine transaminase [Streptococcaceae bacterium]